jgi:hypothetical protein
MLQVRSIVGHLENYQKEFNVNATSKEEFHMRAGRWRMTHALGSLLKERENGFQWWSSWNQRAPLCGLNSRVSFSSNNIVITYIYVYIYRDTCTFIPVSTQLV